MQHTTMINNGKGMNVTNVQRVNWYVLSTYIDRNLLSGNWEDSVGWKQACKFRKWLLNKILVKT